jgi:homoserine O-acetyltransferase/O-succinyltransferase
LPEWQRADKNLLQGIIMTLQPPIEIFSTRDFPLECGVVLPEAKLAWRMDGERNATAPILTVTAFTRFCDDLAYLSVPGAALDPAQRWIIRAEMLGNGRSSSPSNTAPPYDGQNFPPITQRDNVALQKLLLDHLGIPSLHAVIGGSMGGQQAIQWAVSHPERVQRAVVIVGQAVTSWHGQLFLRSMAEALRSASGDEGLKRMSRAWAPWALSPRFFSRGLHALYADTAAPTIEAFLGLWEQRYSGKNADDILCHLACWMCHDVTQTPGLPNSLAEIGAKTRMPMLFLPCDTDAYFNLADIQQEAAHFPKAQVKVIRSDYGHSAGFGRAKEDAAFVNEAITRFLSDTAALPRK